LGEFKVVAATEGNPAVQIAPNLPLTESQSARLAAAKGPLTLYATMPIDNPALFAELDDAARQSMLPKESLADYANRERKLRDYQLFFHDNYVQTSLISDAISKLNSNIERTNSAAEETRREIAYREGEKTNLAADLEKFQLEVRAISAYQKSLEDLFAKVRQSLKSTYAENRKLATALTVAQLQAAEAINARTDIPSAATP
jgi:chromosome segregation ATPase